MSKMDNLRAMREARYARTSAQPRPPAPKRPEVVRAAEPSPPEVPSTGVVPESSEASDELCGHRNIGGRTCTRERGHSAKSHRYS